MLETPVCSGCLKPTTSTALLIESKIDIYFCTNIECRLFNVLRINWIPNSTVVFNPEDDSEDTK